MASTSGRAISTTSSECSKIEELFGLCMPNMARLACQRKAVTHESLEVRWRGRCAEGRHNPNSGDWDTIEVVVTTAIEVQARKRRQRQQERGQERYLLQKPLLQTARIIGGSGSCSSGRQWRWQSSSSRHSCCGSPAV